MYSPHTFLNSLLAFSFLTFNDFTAQNMSKVIFVPSISLNVHFWPNYNVFVHVVPVLLCFLVIELNNHSTTIHETWYLHRFW